MGYIGVNYQGIGVISFKNVGLNGIGKEQAGNGDKTQKVAMEGSPELEDICIDTRTIAQSDKSKKFHDKDMDGMVCTSEIPKGAQKEFIEIVHSLKYERPSCVRLNIPKGLRGVWKFAESKNDSFIFGVGGAAIKKDQLECLRKLFAENSINAETLPGVIFLDDSGNVVHLELRDVKKIKNISSLKGFPYLMYLDLSGTQVSDGDISILKGLSHLRVVKLDFVQITDINVLKELSNLFHLSICGAKVSKEKIDSFRKIRPDVRINCGK